MVVGDHIYYSGKYEELVTAVSNLDLTQFSPVQTTDYVVSPPFNFPSSDYIYTSYINLFDDQVYTSRLRYDQSGFEAIKQTDSPGQKHRIYPQVVGDRIYYTYMHDVNDRWQVITAGTDLDMLGWQAVQRTNYSDENQISYIPTLWNGHVRFQVAGDKIYYVWSLYDDNGYMQIWTAEMYKDGIGWVQKQRTFTLIDKWRPELHVVGSKVYLVWWEGSGDWTGGTLYTGFVGSNIVAKVGAYGLGMDENRRVSGFINNDHNYERYLATNSTSSGESVFGTTNSDWNYVVLTYNKTYVRLYINGELVAEKPFNDTVKENPFSLMIGDDFKGIIDEVRILNRALSGEEIEDIFLSAIAGDNPHPPTLLFPNDQSVINDLYPEFAWSPTAGPRGTYTLQYATDSIFTEGGVTVSDLTETSYMPSNALEDGTSYYWHVKAIDGNGNHSGYQDQPFSFAVVLPPPQAPNGVIDTPAAQTVSVIAGDTVDFSGHGVDPDNTYPLEYMWNFGDPDIVDVTIEAPGPIQFNNPGEWLVTLTVTDADLLVDPTPDSRTVNVCTDTTIDPSDSWNLCYVDSEEVYREDGRAVNAFDGDPNTFWHSAWSDGNPPPNKRELPHWIEIDLGGNYVISGFQYLPRPVIGSGYENGRISEYKFYVGTGNNCGNIIWTEVAHGFFANEYAWQFTCFAPVTGRFVKLEALGEVNGKPFTTVGELSMFGEFGEPLPPQAPNGVIDTPVAQTVSVIAGESVDFSGHGVDPDNTYPLEYMWNFGDPDIVDVTIEAPGPIQFNNPGEWLVTLTVTDADLLVDPTPDSRTVNVCTDTTIDPSDSWNLCYVDSEEVYREDGRAVNAFDGDPNTFWHSAWSDGNPPPNKRELPHWIEIDLGGNYVISGFQYLPRPVIGSGYENGRISEYKFYVGTGNNCGNIIWTEVAHGFFANEYAWQFTCFAPVTGRFVKLEALGEVNGKPFTTVGELSMFGQ